MFSQISQWMTDRRYLDLSPVDAAIRLELIYKVRGVDDAEYYFNNISNQLKSENSYGALLSTYVQEKSVEKAEKVMQKMSELGFANTSYPYNMMITLYAKAGDFKQIEKLIEEMEGKGIPHDIYTLRNRLHAYVAAGDASGFEKTLKEVENKLRIVDWKTYSFASDLYLKIGETEKALNMLKQLEDKIHILKRSLAFEHILSLYARVGNKDELYRVWNQYKPLLKLKNSSYSCMITSLAKMDDIDGAEKIFHEWESSCTMYDFRVVNKLLCAYCQKGLFDKAELLVNKAVQGRTPYASTWNVLAIGYMLNKQMDKAVEMLKKAMLVGRKGWKPNSLILNSCLKYLETQGNAEDREEILNLHKNLELQL